MPDSIDTQIIRLIERQSAHEESQKHLITSIDNLATSMDNVVKSNNELLVSQAELKTHVQGVVDKFDVEINSLKEDVDGIGIRLSNVEKMQQTFDNFIAGQEGGEKAVKSHRENNTRRRTIVFTIISVIVAVVGLVYKVIADNSGV